MPREKAPEKPTRARGRPRADGSHGERVKNQSVDRALDVFKAISTEVTATLKIITATVGLPASTTHRILETLRGHGLVHFDEDTQAWSIGVEAFRIGQGYIRRHTYLDVGREAMRELTDLTGETSNIAIRDGREVVHITQIETNAPIRVFIPAGSRGPLYASGIGKALLANLNIATTLELFRDQTLERHTPKTIIDPDKLAVELTAIRARGWAFDDEERYTGMRCIAAPIFNEFGEAVAGLSISGPSVRLDDAAVAKIAPQVKASADWVTEKIGGMPDPRWMTGQDR